MTTPDATSPLVSLTAAMMQFIEARILCDSWAAQSGARRFVVSNGGHYYLADMTDLRCHHRRDIRHKRASIVHIGHPVVNAPIDVDFAPVGWA